MYPRCCGRICSGELFNASSEGPQKLAHRILGVSVLVPFWVLRPNAATAISTALLQGFSLWARLSLNLAVSCLDSNWQSMRRLWLCLTFQPPSEVPEHPQKVRQNSCVRQLCPSGGVRCVRQMCPPGV